MKLAIRIFAFLFLPLCITSGATNEHSFQRPLSTDRPDATESPYTVEKGRWQVETEVARWSRDSENGNTVEGLVIGSSNFKFGLTNNADLQVIVEPYVRVETRTGTANQAIEGFGDTLVRLKFNLHGNDGGTSAYGIMPFVKIPTAADSLGNGDIEGGVIVPFAMDLPGGWGLGLMGEIDILRNDADTEFEVGTLVTATVAGEIAPRLGVFFEIANEATSTRTSTWATSFNAGVTYAASENLQLDAGTNIGLTGEAEDAVLFLGISARW